MSEPVLYDVRTIGFAVQPEMQLVTLQAVTVDGQLIVLPIAGPSLRLLAEEIERIRREHPEVERWAVDAEH